MYIIQKGELQVRIPHLKILSKKKLIKLLIDAEMPYSEFEAYYKHLQTMQNFDALVDLSGKTLKKQLFLFYIKRYLCHNITIQT